MDITKQCKHCKGKLEPLQPSVEEYLEHKFCIKIFGWKLMFLKEDIAMGCPECLRDEQQSHEREVMDKVVGEAIEREIEKGRLIVNK